MEFWGLEVKPGTTVKCEPGDDYVLHLSQAALGESKKPNENALMYVKFDDQKLALGTLSHDKYPQIQFDLVFEKEFELSHTSKGASVFFSGYKVLQPSEGDEMDFDSSEEEEDEEEEKLNVPVIKENGKAEAKEQKGQGKAAAAASKSNVVPKDVEKKEKDDDDDDDSDEYETDDSDEEDGTSPDEIDDDDSSDEGDSDEDDDDESDEEEETPKKSVVGKKRAAESALKPVSDKKAKVVTPSAQKTGGKKGAAHVSTPHPGKQVSKTPANNDKSKEKSPRSGGSVPCKSCSKTFNSEMALQAHSKAKHAGSSK